MCLWWRPVVDLDEHPTVDLRQPVDVGGSEGVRRGGTLVSVSSDDQRATMAHSIMQRHGAVDIDERSAEWRRGGWTSFDPNAGPYEAGMRRDIR